MSAEENSSTGTPPTICTVDAWKQLMITRNPDGSITRGYEFPVTPADQSDSDSHSNSNESEVVVITRDVPLNPLKGTWVRLYLPNPNPNPKLPIILYFHGGGFIIIHADSTLVHDFCSGIAEHTGSIVVSLEYRLAPEHRLPAAYDDATEALFWLRDQAANCSVFNNPHSHSDQALSWLSRYGDFSKCFLMGDSAGGNMAYHVGLQASSRAHHDLLQPSLRIRGLILHHPFFGGTDRTASELRLANDRLLSLAVTDLMWELALPEGSDRDHHYANVAKAARSSSSSSSPPVLLERVRELGWRVFVTGFTGDPLFDRQVEVAKLLKDKGVPVLTRFLQGEYHAVEIFEPGKAKPLFQALTDFIVN